MKRLLLPFLLLLSVSAFATAPSTAALLDAAKAQAKLEKKNVLVIFHASWCGWCKRLDAFLDDAGMGKLMKDNFVILHLDVLENPDKKALENAGAKVLPLPDFRH